MPEENYEIPVICENVNENVSAYEIPVIHEYVNEKVSAYENNCLSI